MLKLFKCGVLQLIWQYVDVVEKVSLIWATLYTYSQIIASK